MTQYEARTLLYLRRLYNLQFEQLNSKESCIHVRKLCDSTYTGQSITVAISPNFPNENAGHATPLDQCVGRETETDRRMS